MKIKCDTVNGCEYLTAGKEYTVLGEHPRSYSNLEQRYLDILTDTGLRITVLLKDCPHIQANWRVVDALDELTSIGQAMQPEDYVTEEEEEEWKRVEERQYNKYYKDFSDVDEADVYQVHYAFNIEDPSGCIHHASKKLLLSGVRTGGKSKFKDVEEARDTLNRWLEINSGSGE